MKGAMTGRMLWLIVLLVILFFAIALYYIAAHRLVKMILIGG